MKEVHDSSGAILFKSTPEEDPLEKRIVILEEKVAYLTEIVDTLLSHMNDLIR